MANYIPQIDYTSRDYVAIREDMKSLIPYFLPEWTNRDTADFGITLIELFSYMGDILNFYIDRAANESFITTASQRESILRIATLLNYTPTVSTAAETTLTFSNYNLSSVTIPAGTQIATTTIVDGENTQIIFETKTQITVSASLDGITPATNTVDAIQGFTITDELLGTSNGTSDQIYQLAESPVIKDSVEVTIDGVVYQRVDYLVDYSGNDPVFTVELDAEDISYIRFGDNVGGRIPPRNANILSTYRVGAGIDGNLSSNILTELIISDELTNENPSASVSEITVVNVVAATGGSDPESTDSIRINTPISIRAINRAVTLDDYASLAVQVSGVAKAKAIANVYNNVTLYVAPFGDFGVEEDNVTPTTVFNNLSTDIQLFFTNKMPPTTTLTLQPPSYVEVTLEIDVQVLDQYKQATVQLGVQNVLSNLLAYENVTFADRISLQDVLTEVSQVSGVAYATVTSLNRSKLITAASRTLSSTTITLTSAAHGYTTGDVVTIQNVDATVNGTYTIAGYATNTFTVTGVATSALSLTGLTTASATESGVNDIVCLNNEIPRLTASLGNLTVNTSGGIS
jgi:hypothetical protein